MNSTFKYGRYQGYSYRIEFDDTSAPIACAALRSDSSWYPISFGW